jgi:hypothetical protein
MKAMMVTHQIIIDVAYTLSDIIEMSVVLPLQENASERLEAAVNLFEQQPNMETLMSVLRAFGQTKVVVSDRKITQALVQTHAALRAMLLEIDYRSEHRFDNSDIAGFRELAEKWNEEADAAVRGSEDARSESE